MPLKGLCNPLKSFAGSIQFLSRPLQSLYNPFEDLVGGAVGDGRCHRHTCVEAALVLLILVALGVAVPMAGWSIKPFTKLLRSKVNSLHQIHLFLIQTLNFDLHWLIRSRFTTKSERKNEAVLCPKMSKTNKTVSSKTEKTKQVDDY